MTTRESTLKALLRRYEAQLATCPDKALIALYAREFDESPPEGYPPTRMINALLRDFRERIEAMSTATLMEYLSPGTFDESNLERDR